VISEYLQNSTFLNVETGAKHPTLVNSTYFYGNVEPWLALAKLEVLL
jgi:hypothetical protein